MNTHVAFPLCLQVLEQPSEGTDRPPKEWAELDPRRSSLRRYELFGVVEHSGTYKDGHYTAYVRTGGSAGSADGGSSGGTAWNCFSDSKVTAASETQVLSAQAFLLFYALQGGSGFGGSGIGSSGRR